MMYVISKATFGSYNVRDIQFNVNWTSCPYSDYALIPDSMVDGILATKGYCDITLNSTGTEVVSFKARTIPSVPEECCGENTVLSVNGVKANTAGEITLTNDDVDAAPAGYGLGDVSNMQNIYDWATLNAATASGWYYVTLALNSFSNSVLRVDSNDDIVIQHQFAHYNGLWVELVRSKIGGWSDWEWVNPPMTPGIEYRTTERWNGKAVYTKLVNGGIVGTGGVMVYWSFAKTPTHIVRTTAKINTEAIGDIVLPHIYGTMESGYTAVCAPCRDSILFVCGANVTGQAYAQVWYTYD